MKFPTGIPVYGDVKFRGKCPRETVEMVTFFNRLRKTMPHLAPLAFHVDNERARTWQQAAFDKAEGMTTGIADIIILGRIPFVCEMKRRDHTQSKLSDEQEMTLLAAKDAGCFACIALGVDATMQAIEAWLKITVDGKF
jgi:hypothetical protein